MQSEWGRVGPAAATFLCGGIVLGAVAVLFALSPEGNFSTRGRRILATIAALVLAIAAYDLWGSAGDLGSQAMAVAGNAGVVAPIVAMIWLDHWNAHRRDASKTLVARAAWITLGFSVLLMVAWNACLYFYAASR
jgi:hypothetical protein